MPQFLGILFDNSRIVARDLLKLQPALQEDNQHAKSRLSVALCIGELQIHSCTDAAAQSSDCKPEKWCGVAKTVLKCRDICIKYGVGFISCAIAHAQTNPEVHIAACDKVLSCSACPSTLFSTE